MVSARRVNPLKSAKQNGDRVVMARHDLAVLLQFLGNRRRQDTQQQILRFLLRIVDRNAAFAQLGERVVELDHAPAQLQLRHHLAGQPEHGLALLEADFTGLEIDDTQGAERVAIRPDQRHAAVKPQVRRPADHRVVAKRSSLIRPPMCSRLPEQIVVEQIEISRGIPVKLVGRPYFDFFQSWTSSTKPITATGQPQICAASSVISS